MKIFNRTIALILLVGTLSFSGVLTVVPIAHADTPTLFAIHTSDAALQSVGCGVSVFGLCIPFTSLNSFAYFIARTMIQKLTGSVVNWINSGFNGNPSFVTDPGGFFADYAGEQIGLMIQNSADLKFLCSPFSADIRIALAFKYRPFQQRISCTLNDVIKNVKGAVANSSINGFRAGDFKQGGWPAFISMSTEPQNNVYGAYLEASDQLEINIADMQAKKRDELGQGKGFMSWKKCTEYASDNEGSSNFVGKPSAAQASFIGPLDVDHTNDGKKGVPCTKTEVQTPGSVIESQLETQLGTGIRQLELANSFNEVVNALVAQMVNKVLTAGLRGSTGNGPSDTSSTINQVQNASVQSTQQDAIANNNTLTTAAQTANGLGGISAATGGSTNVTGGSYTGLGGISAATETSYRDQKAASLKLVTDLQGKFAAVIACYNTRYIYGTNTYTLGQTDVRNSQTQMDSLIPRVTKLNIDITKAENNIKTILDVSSGLNSAKPENISSTVQRYTSLIQSGTLHTSSDVTDAENETASIAGLLAPLNNNAVKYQTDCNNNVR